jgi:hypothetical protein
MCSKLCSSCHSCVRYAWSAVTALG